MAAGPSQVFYKEASKFIKIVILPFVFHTGLLEDKHPKRRLGIGSYPRKQTEVYAVVFKTPDKYTIHGSLLPLHVKNNHLYLEREYFTNRGVQFDLKYLSHQTL